MRFISICQIHHRLHLQQILGENVSLCHKMSKCHFQDVELVTLLVLLVRSIYSDCQQNSHAHMHKYRHKEANALQMHKDTGQACALTPAVALSARETERMERGDEQKRMQR